MEKKVYGQCLTPESERWDRHFLRLALVNAEMSKDPRKQVGSVIVGSGRAVVSCGFNGFPRGIADTTERLYDRELKLPIIVHAEMNAILNAARIGVALLGCTLYLSVVGHPPYGIMPCGDCTKHLIQTGIARVVTYELASGPSTWHKESDKSRSWLNEVGIAYTLWPVLTA